MGLQTLEWDDVLLDWLNIPRSLLPRIVGNIEVVGECTLFGPATRVRDELAAWFRLAPGDIQMVSNHSVFHSRLSFEDHDDPDARRCLFRFWVNIRGGRALADNFADRYNTGPRGC